MNQSEGKRRPGPEASDLEAQQRRLASWSLVRRGGDRHGGHPDDLVEELQRLRESYPGGTDGMVVGLVNETGLPAEQILEEAEQIRLGDQSTP